MLKQLISTHLCQVAGGAGCYLVGFNCAEAIKGIKHQRCRRGSERFPRGGAGGAQHRAAESPWGPGAIEALTLNSSAGRLRPLSLGLFCKP